MSEPAVVISVIVPVYYSAGIFPHLYARVVEALRPLTEAFEIIAVVDGCTDESARVVADIHDRDPRVKLIEFSRNFGNQMAISAGLQHCAGEFVVVIDDDLEDPPELIPALYARALEGYDVVYAKRRTREISRLQGLLFKGYYSLFSRISNFDIPEDVGDYCLMRRQVVDVLNSMPERHRYVRGLRAWTGFRQSGVEFDRASRHSGRSGFSLGSYLRFAFDGIYSFSYFPLMLSVYLGFLVSAVSLVLAVVFLVAKLLGMLPDVPGWASLAVIVLFIGGVQLLSVGAVGQYVGRIYDEVKQRPPYVIKRAVGIATPRAHARQ